MSKKYIPPRQTVWDFISRPLDSLWLYFHLYNGANFKYAEQAIQFIDLLKNLQYKADRLLVAIIGFLFDIGEIVIAWTGRAIVWILKSALTIIVLAMTCLLILELTYAREEIIKSLELRVIEWYLLVYLPLRLFLVIGLSYFHMIVWNNRSSDFGTIAISHGLFPWYSLLSSILDVS